LADYFSQVVAEIGAKAEQNLKLQAGATVVTTQIENQRLSVMGVSMDEELTHMIQYQQGYNASARLISTVNEMLDVIINLGR
jgi:flagellar hook-associated protein 1 FlgK